ncbi:MAG: transcription termination factor NusA [Planctomycetes bacterium]|nr:transcription termination factor NusA [Planctomycetota bacterium]
MANELLRLIDAIHREKGIDRDLLFDALESAMTTAARKHLHLEDDFDIKIDRKTGEMELKRGDEEYEVAPEIMGRIAAQTAKQIFHQKVREAEQDNVLHQYSQQRGEIVMGRVSKFEGDTIVVDLNNRVEGIIPRDQRIRGENYKPGDAIRCLIYDVKKVGQRVRIILSRSNPDLVARLFEIEVPEIDEGIIHIRSVVREPGYRTKIAVSSTDAKIDCVGACVGIRGSRIKSIIDELNGERIDIIRWSDSLEMLVKNALKPAEIDLDDIYPDPDTRRVTVIVDEDQQSLAIGRRGQNVRLASALCRWEIDIKTRAEIEAEIAGGGEGAAPAATEGASPEEDSLEDASLQEDNEAEAEPAYAGSGAEPENAEHGDGGAHSSAPPSSMLPHGEGEGATAPGAEPAS